MPGRGRICLVVGRMVVGPTIDGKLILTAILLRIL